LSNPINANDGLNLSNYTITGPVPVGISSISPVGGDPQAVYLYLGSLWVTGTYTLAVANVESIGSYSLVAPTVGSFSFQQSTNERINAGSTNSTPEQIIRKHISSGIAQYQPNWSALIEGLSAGDQINFDNAKNAFRQLFISGADGVYLDRRAADQGVLRPSSVGLIDELFRKLVIKLKNKKLVTQALLEVLEIFYGTDATRAHATSDIAQPYNISTNDILKVKIDGGGEIVIQFEQDDFALPTAASAREVAASITRWLLFNKSNGYALPYFDPQSNSTKVRIYSGALGIRSSVEITGGRAQDSLQFPELLTQGQPGDSWSISSPEPFIYQFTKTGATTTDLSLVQSGDYVNIFGTNFNANNRGTFEVIDVDVRYTPGLVQYFTIRNESGSIQTPAIALSTDLMFYRPTKETINTGERAVLVVQPTTGAEVNVQLPVTTRAVVRTPPYAAYLKKNTDLAVSTLVRNPDGTVTVTTGSSHGLSANEQVWIEGIEPNSELADITPNPSSSLTDASLSDVFAGLDDPPPYARYNTEVTYVGEQPWFIGGSVNTSGSPASVPTLAAWTVDVAFDSTLADGSNRYSYTWTNLASVYSNWAAVGDREFHTANYLNSGAVAVFGGRSVSTAGYTALGTGAILPGTLVLSETWASFSLSSPVMLHQSTVLPNSDIFISGGAQREYHSISSVQGYSQTSSNAISSISLAPGVTNLTVPRIQHRQVLLDNGNLLIIGGRSLSQSHEYNASTCLVHWKLDETSGGAIAVDSGPTSPLYNLSPLGGPGVLPELINYSRDLTPSGSYLNASGGGVAATTLVGDWSIEFWTNNISSIPGVDHVFISHGFSTVGPTFNILAEVGHNTSDRIYVKWQNGTKSDVITSGTISPAAFISSIGTSSRSWHQVGVTKKFNGTDYDVSIYIDGLLYHSATGIANSSGGTAGNWYVGRSADVATDLQAAVDDIYISTVALPSTDILRNYIRGYGKVSDVSGQIHETVEVYDSFNRTLGKTGSMMYARYAFEAIRLPENQCLVIGGYGHKAGKLYHPTYSNIVGPVGALELYDGNSGRWYVVGNSQIIEGSNTVPGSIKAFYFEESNKVYIVGLTNSGTDISEMLTEVYDVATRKLSLVSRRAIYSDPDTPVTSTPIVNFAAASYKDLESYDDLIIITGGTDTTLTTTGTIGSTDTSFLYVAGSGASSGGVNQQMLEVLSTPSATQFTVNTEDYRFYTKHINTQATVTRFSQAASASGQPGPYILDPNGLYSISDTETLTTINISSGQHVNLLQVTPGSASLFPDEPGWLVLGFGNDKQTVPVKYLGRAGPDNLILDYTFSFEDNLPSGTSVTLLAQYGGFVPENPEELGLFYITNSTSGRIVASQLVDSIAAAGVKVNKNIIYPSSVGLGAEFYSETGSKVSDNVSVFAGDDIDTEVARARNELDAEEI
jgi:hypothetical protein